MIKDMYIHDLQVQRKVIQRLADGGFQESWQVIKTMKGRVIPSNLQVRQFYSAAKEQANVQYTVFCDVVDLQVNDVILFRDKKLKVVNVREPSNMGHHLEIDCELVE